MAPLRIATYRLQLLPNLDLDGAMALVEPLRALGVSHLYLSPIQQAAPGSTHGYDVADPLRVATELGGAEALARLRAMATTAGLRLLLDVVPNHQAADGRASPAWWDVLEDGRQSPHADDFDVDWSAPAPLTGRVAWPHLDEAMDTLLERGEIHAGRDGGDMLLRYGDRELPLAIDTAARLLASAGLDDLARATGSLPHGGDAAARTLRADQRRRLHAELASSPPGKLAALDARLAAIEGDALRVLLDAQRYLPLPWREGARILNYRRFFDITGLVGVRVEDECVMRATHALVVDLLAGGDIDLRIDHIDGLRDPLAYLQRLREAAPRVWVVVEKILAAGETPPSQWPVDGTTGYEFARVATGVLIDPAGEAPMTVLCESFTGVADTTAEGLATDGRRQALSQLFEPDVSRLVRLVSRIAARRRPGIDGASLRTAIVELATHLAVYRTYVRPGEPPRPEDIAALTVALDRARTAEPAAAPALELLCELLLHPDAQSSDEVDLALRFPQLTSAATAKGVEDTAFYRDHRLIALCEVGGAPERFGVALEELHAHNLWVATHMPSTLLALSTHDTKRSGDARARLALLSEIPGRWGTAARRWREHNRRHRRGEFPDGAAEYLLYQCLVAAHPLDADRAAAFMEKATREAKLHTSWMNPSAGYEAALRDFVAAVCEDQAFLEDLTAFMAPLIPCGRVNSLTQTLLQLTSPGIPDIYNGDELWNLSLVDPDNRRAVDFEARIDLLATTSGCTATQAWQRAATGLPKLFTIRRALELRRRRPDLFAPGSAYTPMSAHGAGADHVIAYARGDGAIAVAPRLVTGIGGMANAHPLRWDDTAIELAPGRWHDMLGSGEHSGSVPLETLLADFPVALLVRAE